MKPFTVLVLPAVVFAGNTADAADWWALRPVVEPPVPALGGPGADWARTPVDAFILAKLRERGLTPAPEADRRTLIRRLTFDLHGLPPSPEEVEAFVSDTAPDACERLVDRLLASPRYGERWGRHWLDVVHYGESHGYDKDKPRPHAWPYRDYVIRALNEDRPYARFIAEQLAGDILYPDEPDGIVATGFIAAGPWDFVGHVELREGTTDKDITRANDRDDMVTTVMSAFASVTANCARCHDHKFDPIPQRDYYGLQAVFAGVDRADRSYDPDPTVHRRRRALAAARREVEAGLAGAKTEDLELKLRDLETQITALPPARLVYAAASDFAPSGAFTPSRGPRPVHLLKRGDVRSPGDLVAPGALSCVPGLERHFALADPSDEGSRRAALARWLADPRNPLTWRSIVNRVWHYHFGRGIVDTPGDFGLMGSTPTHSELLDWLAAWFLEHGGSLKRLHRLILASAAYRQSSRGGGEGERIDPENAYLWRMHRARLDAESLRDAILFVSGTIDLTPGGPPASHFRFHDDHSPVYDYAAFDVDDPASRRRSVYRHIVRSVPDPLMECLDSPDPSLLTPKRNTTITALQALAVLNSPFAVRYAEHFAERVRKLRDGVPDQVELASRLALGRPPRPEEAALLAAHAAEHGLESLCRVLLNANEFIFID